ncbi:MAG: plastocyanin/azurin family copper-binding protein [Cyclobacteriaceae bacterium]|jgi:plastocyanin|nr:plastocyanin/azurin family copper-binding protein [Cyclobacteriaceae bacterium]
MRVLFWSSLLIAALATGCGGSQGDPAAASSDDSGNVPKKHVVEISQMKFVPDVLYVSKGDTIVWINKDMVEHDVTEEATNAWTSSRIPAGGSWEMVATQSDAYFCSLHVVMKGKIIVDGNELAMAEAIPSITQCGSE